jgi:hypothetical protein
MHQPTQISRKLLRLGARQQHAEIQCVQETRLVDPLPFINHDAMHQGDLPGRPTEVDAADLQPHQKGLGKARPGSRFRACHARHAALAGQLCRSSAAKRSQANSAS